MLDMTTTNGRMRNSRRLGGIGFWAAQLQATSICGGGAKVGDERRQDCLHITGQTLQSFGLSRCFEQLWASSR
jgi:hypothetical protein